MAAASVTPTAAVGPVESVGRPAGAAEDRFHRKADLGPSGGSSTDLRPRGTYHAHRSHCFFALSSSRTLGKAGHREELEKAGGTEGTY